jgi:hypothetical protein
MSQTIVDDLRTLRSARVVFLHHSVGQNILDAVSRLDREVDGAHWPMVGVDEALRLEGGLLAHLSGGANLAPRTKIDAFIGTLLDRPDLRADIAVMKLCYVDIEPGTDVDALVNYYRDSVRALRTFRPAVRIVHMTVPLKARPTGVRAGLRRLVGRPVWEDEANARRDDFNRRLRAAFPDEPIFDLAAVEAHVGDRSPTQREPSSPPDGSSIPPALDPRFTDDGGHLNPTGARVVAVAWIHFLADVVRASARTRESAAVDHPASLATTAP